MNGRGDNYPAVGNNHLTSGNKPWQQIVTRIARKWTAESPEYIKMSGRYRPDHGAVHDERVFRNVGFTDVETYPLVYSHVWTIESILGNLYSTSRYSKWILGERVGNFEDELRTVLLDHYPSGRYSEDMPFGYTLARKPLS